MHSDAVFHRLTAILSSDAVGYSRLLTDDQVATVRTLQVHRHPSAFDTDDMAVLSPARRPAEPLRAG